MHINIGIDNVDMYTGPRYSDNSTMFSESTSFPLCRTNYSRALTFACTPPPSIQPQSIIIYTYYIIRPVNLADDHRAVRGPRVFLRCQNVMYTERGRDTCLGQSQIRKCGRGRTLGKSDYCCDGSLRCRYRIVSLHGR